MISKSECPDCIDFSVGEIILMDKPKGITSFDVIREIRKFAYVKKIGHAGTLDPLASGLLVLCTGLKTKMIGTIQTSEKVYTGEMVLGAKTASYDLETEPDEFFDISAITSDMIMQTLKNFTGTISQVPPAYSAVKVMGKPMYKRAKKGEKVDLQSRIISIYEFRLEKIDMPSICFYVRCSKGTYIRSLVHDFGLALNCGAYLSGLRRTAIGQYSVNEALTPEEFGDLIKTRIIIAY